MPEDGPALHKLGNEYRRYLAQCKHLGVKPALRDRVRKLIKEWADALTAAREKPP